MVRAAYNQDGGGIQPGQYSTDEDARDDEVLAMEDDELTNPGDDEFGDDPKTPKRGGVVRNSDNPDIMEYLAQQEDEYVPISETFPFAAFVGLSTFANLQVLAIESDYGCIKFSCTSADRSPFSLADHVFTFLFFVEIAITMFDHGVKGYFRGDKLQHKLGFHVFHCFDFTIVILRALDVWILSMAGIQTGLKLVSAVRVAHMAFFVKRVRLVATFRELWLVISGMGETMKTVLWVASLQFLVTWVFGIMLTIIVGKDDPKDFDFRQSKWSKDEYWGSVSRSMFSLFQCLTMDSWSDSLAWPLIKQRTELVVVFIAFQCIAVLALLNTIIGVVVESTLTSARNNEEKEGKQKQSMDAMVMESLRTIFHEADTDGSGDLDWDELQAAKKNIKVRDRMKLLGIPFRDLDLLFSLLDETGSGAIKTDAFFRGCCRLRGPAMACDLHHMSVDLGRNIDWASNANKTLITENDLLGDLLDHIDAVDIDIVKGDHDEKDPVLMARRGRARQPKANFLRTQNWAESGKAPHPLLMKDSVSEAGSKSRNSSKASVRKSSLMASSLRASAQQANIDWQQLNQQMMLDEDGEPPAPPPLPAHLMSLTEGEQPQRRTRSKSQKGYGQKKQFFND